MKGTQTTVFTIDNSEDEIVERVVRKIRERSGVGIKKYNTTLFDNNSDDFLKHLQEELMDSVNYIEKLMQKNNN
tara:strand:+ start:154 stop:375 length:222 start_codon:yes stop_codon:yes gene_type:complete